MAEQADRELAAPTSVGHVSVRLEHMHPKDVPFSFETQAPRLSGAMGFSTAFHALVIVGLMFLAAWLPDVGPIDLGQALEDTPTNRIVFLSEPGPGGGGGGGGNKSIEPPRVAQDIGKDKLTVPVSKPAEIVPVKSPEDELPKVDFNIPAKAMASAEQSLVGVIDGMKSSNSTTSQGSGSGGGAGTGTGTGIGPGTGSGLGPGWGGGTGGGAYRMGAGIEAPKALYVPKPEYTADAMRAKVQGMAVLECIVTVEGTTSDCQIVRSLDSSYGLDQKAVVCARMWRFTTGKRQGQPVPVYFQIELMFNLR